MPDREELMYGVAFALRRSRSASEVQEATDQGEGSPDTAALLHQDAVGLLNRALDPLLTLRDSHISEARRMKRLDAA